LLKAHATRTAQLTATDAVQIFGGRGITKTGMYTAISFKAHNNNPHQGWEVLLNMYVAQPIIKSRHIDFFPPSIIVLCHSTLF